MTFLALSRHPQPLPIGDELDGAVLVCAVNTVLPQHASQPLRYFVAGVAKGVICSHTDDRHFRVNRRQKLLTGGGLAAMMGYL